MGNKCREIKEETANFRKMTSLEGAASVPPSKGSQERRKPIPDDFLFGKMIGEGSFSCVFLAKDIRSAKEVAIKVCDKNQIRKEKKTEYILRERDILKHLTDNWNTNVPYFVRLHASFHDSHRLYFVITYAKNGDLFKFIAKLTAKAIDCTQFYAGELVSAVEYLHNQGIIHRDLKPENILLNERMHILITDFGSAKRIHKSKRKRRRTGDNAEEPIESDGALEDTSGEEDDEEGSDTELSPPKPKRCSFVGTPEYVSPEMFSSRGSSRASDLWAIGCIIYQMISGIPPFQSKSEYIIFKKIEKLDYSFHEGFDPNAKDLVKRLLVIEPKDRLGAMDKKFYTSIRDHPFYKGLDFDKLHKALPTELVPFVKDSDAPDPVWAKYPDLKPGVEGMMKRLVGDTSSDEEQAHFWNLNDDPDSPDAGHTHLLQVPGYYYNDNSKRSRSGKKSILKPLLEWSEEERADKLKQQSL